MKLFKKKKYTDKYLCNLIIKAGNLAQLWQLEAESLAKTGDVKRMERILNHLYRISKIQQLARLKLYEVK